jgi:hypothetical protein
MTNPPVQAPRLFIEALNARDVESLRALATEDVELRNREGKSFQGERGLALVVDAAIDSDTLVARTGPEGVAGGRVDMPVRVIVRKGDLHGTATFDIRDGAVAGFQVVTEV